MDECFKFYFLSKFVVK